MKKTKLLVIVDMQEDFTRGALGNAECVAAIDGILAILEENEYDGIIFTRDTHQANYMDTQEGRKLPVVHCIEGSAGWQVVPELVEAVEKKYKRADIYYFDKPTFGSVTLGQFLQDSYGDGESLQIDYAGVCTGICVISNVVLAKAFMTEADVRVIASGCACVTPETHETALAAMKTFQVDVI